MTKAFISYQTTDKVTAGLLKQELSNYNIDGFLAHDDLEVSDEWREEILKNFKKSSLFICLLSQNYLESDYCIQESGMAVIANKKVIALSLDGTLPPGFLSVFQAKKIFSQNPTIKDVINGLLKHNKETGIDVIIELIGRSGTFRSAEANFKYLEPFINDLSDTQVKTLIKKMLDNNQVYDAHLCATVYFPQIVKEYKSIMTKKEFDKIKKICRSFKVSI